MPYLLFLFALLPFLSKANNHVLVPLVAFHLDQKTIPGYGLAYHFQFRDSFELDLAVIHSNDLEVQQAQKTTSGHYTSVFIGSSFLKPYNNELAIRAGVGLSYSLSSSNEQLLAKEQVAPYIKLSAKYRLSPDFNIEIGQISSFGTGRLGNNHSLFMGIAWSFGRADNTPVIKQPKNTIRPKAVSAITNKKISAPVKRLKPIKVIEKNWTVQLAAYQNISNAVHRRLTLQKLFKRRGFNEKVVLVSTNELHKLVTSSVFMSRSSAKAFTENIYDLFTIGSFVTPTSRPISVND